MKDPSCTRRSLLKNAACGFGYLAWAGLASEQAALANGFRNPLLPKKPHFEAKAKRVILMFMQGGPSQHDTFEYNPELDKAAGQEVGSELNGVNTSGKILPAQFKFQRHGQSGIYISEIFPELAKHADDLCLLNGMHTDTPAHPQATVFAHTGSITFVRPSIGAWALYGLGTENQDLPGVQSQTNNVLVSIDMGPAADAGIETCQQINLLNGCSGIHKEEVHHPVRIQTHGNLRLLFCRIHQGVSGFPLRQAVACDLVHLCTFEQGEDHGKQEEKNEDDRANDGDAAYPDHVPGQKIPDRAPAPQRQVEF